MRRPAMTPDVPDPSGETAERGSLAAGELCTVPRQEGPGAFGPCINTVEHDQALDSERGLPTVRGFRTPSPSTRETTSDSSARISQPFVCLVGGGSTESVLKLLSPDSGFGGEQHFSVASTTMKPTADRSLGLESPPDEASRSDVTGELPCVGGFLLEKFAPRELEQGAPFEYRIEVTNSSQATVQSVVLVESLLSLIEVHSCSPKPQSTEAHGARWVLGPLWPGDTQVLHLVCVSRKRMRFRSHTSLSYSFES